MEQEKVESSAHGHSNSSHRYHGTYSNDSANNRAQATNPSVPAGSSVLGEVPSNRIAELPVILYRSLQEQDRDQV